MSAADWTIQQTGYNSAEPYVSELPAPSPASGSYARGLYIPNVVNYVYMYPSSSSFSGVANTKAIRVSCYFRGAAGRDSSAVNMIFCKGNINGSDFDNFGYHLFWNEGSLVVRSNNVNLATLRSVSQNVWYSWRMSVYPISSGVDRIICEFESSPGANDWSSTWPSGSGDLYATGSNFRAWGGSTKNGIGTWRGFSGGSLPLYVDMLQVSLADTPVPVP